MKCAIWAVLFFSLLALGCAEREVAEAEAPVDDSICDPDNGGLTLPDGFCAVVVAEDLGRARHLAVRDNGDVYVILRRADEAGGIVAVRDTTGDGKADIIERFSAIAGTGIRIHDGYLYASSDSSIVRYRLEENALVPRSTHEVVVAHVPERGQHAAKSFTFDGSGNLYVNVGAPSNNCQEQPRTPGSPGLDPCPILEQFGGIWRFDAAGQNQTQEEHGTRYATGIRNAVALDWSDQAGNLYAVQHGRDQLDQFWPETYTAEQNAQLPPEEFLLVEKDGAYGWPYCYYDPQQGKRVLAPEYGGNGTEVGRCVQYPAPVLALPAHYAPNDLLFYEGGQFPDRYHGGAFIAFHGSWNRAPLGQEGFNVVFVPFDGAQPAGDWEVFADGFAGIEEIESPSDAEHRPMGLSVGPDGALYVSDSVKGTVWRVLYTGR